MWDGTEHVEDVRRILVSRECIGEQAVCSRELELARAMLPEHNSTAEVLQPVVQRHDLPIAEILL